MHIMENNVGLMYVCDKETNHAKLESLCCTVLKIFCPKYALALCPCFLIFSTHVCHILKSQGMEAVPKYSITLHYYFIALVFTHCFLLGVDV